MKLIVIHRNSSIILHQGPLVVMPGVGSSIYINEKILFDLVNKWYERDTDGTFLFRPDTTRLNLDTHNCTTVLFLEHCPITGDTKAFVGATNELTRQSTNSSIVQKHKSNSRQSNQSNDDGFLDAYLVIGAAISISNNNDND